MEAEAELHLDTSNFDTEVKAAEAKLANLARQAADPEVDLDMGAFAAELALTEQLLRGIDGEKVSAEVNLKIAKAFAQIEALRAMAEQDIDIDANVLGRLAGNVGGIGEAMAGAGMDAVADGADTATDAVSTFGDTVSQVFSRDVASMIISGAAMLSLFMFLAPIVVALAGAFIAFAAALAAALAVVGAMTVAFTALAAVGIMGLVAAVSAATLGMKRLEEQEQKAAAAVDRHRAAIEARRSAHEQLNASSAAVASAQERERLATEDLAAAYEEAQRRLEDLQNQQDSAALTAKQAAIDVARAEKALKKIEEEGGTRLERKQARLDVQKALEAQDQAQLDATRSTEDLAAAEAKGIEGADNVVAARRAVEDARRATIEALRQQTKAQNDFDRAQRRSAATAAQLARRQRHAGNARRGGIGALADAWQRFQKILRGVGKAFEPLFRAARPILRMIGNFFKDNKGAIRRFARSLGDTLVKLTDEFTNPAWQRFFRFLLRTFGELAKGPASDVFIQLLRILRGLARAAMPLVERGLKSLAGWLRGIGRDTNFKKWLQDLMPAFRAFKRLAVAVADALLALFDKGKGPGTQFVRWLARGIEDFAKSLRDPKNRGEVKDFFEDAIDLTKSFIKLLIRVGRVGIRWFRKLKPVVNSVLQIFDDILTALGDIIDMLPDLGDLPDFLPGVGDSLEDEIRDEAARILGKPASAIDHVQTGPGGVGPASITEINHKPVKGKGKRLGAVAAGAGAGGGDATFQITVPGGGPPDPDAMVTAISRRMRDRGWTLS
jgi:hypothetical protein